MRPSKLLHRIATGHVTNVRFADLVRLLESCGFEVDRISGSHHVLVHPELRSLVNLQDVGGQAKPYQVRQVWKVLQRYDLRPEERS